MYIIICIYVYICSYVRLPEGKVLPEVPRAALSHWWMASNKSIGSIPSGYLHIWGFPYGL